MNDIKICKHSGTPYQTFRFKVSDDPTVRLEFLARFINLGEKTILNWRGEWHKPEGAPGGFVLYEIEVNATKYNRTTPQTHIAEFTIAMLGVFNDPNIEYMRG